MREIDTGLVRKTVKDLILKANIFLCPDIKNELIKKEKEEKSEIGKGLLNVINENIKVAARELSYLPRYGDVYRFFGGRTGSCI